MVNKILVAIDGSENSKRALSFAVDLADKFSAGLTILNVTESSAVGTMPQDPLTYGGGGVAVFARELRRFHEEILSKALAEANALKPGIQASTKLREGNAAAEIVAEAKEGGFDVAVLGHVGTGRVKEFFGLGGISEKVTHSAPCTVVIVR